MKIPKIVTPEDVAERARERKESKRKEAFKIAEDRLEKIILCVNVSLMNNALTDDGSHSVGHSIWSREEFCGDLNYVIHSEHRKEVAERLIAPHYSECWEVRVGEFSTYFKPKTTVKKRWWKFWERT